MKKYIITYGIAYVDEQKGGTELLSSVPNLSTDKKQVEDLVQICNKHSLSPIHLTDVIEDMFAATE